MSTRTDHARRLELTQVQEVGELVTGQAKGMAVKLEGEPPFSACIVELRSALPIARMVMQLGDLNHPDAVETGDGDFDEVMQVTALPSYAPTLQTLLAEPPLRAALLEFFRRHPFAEFNGTRLRVPVKGGVTQQSVIDALAIVDTVERRFAVIGFLESEAPTPVERGLTGRLALNGALTGSLCLLFGWYLEVPVDVWSYLLGAHFVATSMYFTWLAQREVAEPRSEAPGVHRRSRKRGRGGTKR